jgi:hypothetical protein
MNVLVDMAVLGTTHLLLFVWQDKDVRSLSKKRSQIESALCARTSSEWQMGPCIQAEMSRAVLTSDGHLHLFLRQMAYNYR